MYFRDDDLRISFRVAPYLGVDIAYSSQSGLTFCWRRGACFSGDILEAKNFDENVESERLVELQNTWLKDFSAKPVPVFSVFMQIV